MNKCVFSIGSVTHAIKAQRALSEHSIPSKVVKTNNDRHNRGCTYGIETELVYKSNAVRLLDMYGIGYVINNN